MLASVREQAATRGGAGREAYAKTVVIRPASSPNPCVAPTPGTYPVLVATCNTIKTVHNLLEAAKHNILV